MKLALDIDGVIADFTGGICKLAHELGFSHWPKSHDEVNNWSISSDFMVVFEQVMHQSDFWLGLEPLPNTLDFKPFIYLTARPIASDITKEWLKTHNFPKADVITVSDPQEKLQILQAKDVDILIDDYYRTIDQINKSDCKTIGLLYAAPYQRGHEDEIANMMIVDRLEQRHIVDQAVKQLSYKYPINYIRND